MARRACNHRASESFKFSAVLVAIVSVCAATAAVTTAAPHPQIVKPCGAIHARGKRQRVDIDEARGNVARSCSAARAVMRRFLHHAGSYSGPNGSSVTYKGRTYGCYVSRPDGEGWDYHCNWFSSSGDSFIDYGAGRRF
ncbi:MAG: hypothetical protein ACTHLH_08880 [Solirubrobacterales bacterium]